MRKEMHGKMMHGKILVGLSLLLGAVPLLSMAMPSQAQTVEAINRVGYRAELAEELHLAESMWRSRLELNPEDAEAQLFLGFVLLDQERWAEAETAFTQALALSPEPSFGQSFGQVSEQSFGPESIYLGLGTAYRRQGQFAAAKSALQTAVELNDQVPFTYQALGRLLRDYGELEAAAAAFEAIVQLEPTAPHGAEAFWDLGKTQMAQGNVEAAERSYQSAIALDPDNIEFQQSLFTLLRRQGRSADASEVARTISQLQIAQAESRATAGGFPSSFAETADENPLKRDFGTTHYQTLATDAQALVEQFPDMVDAHIKLGYALRSLGQFAESAAALRRAIELNPENPLAHQLLSYLLTDLGDDVASETAQQTALSLSPALQEQTLEQVSFSGLDWISLGVDWTSQTGYQRGTASSYWSLNAPLAIVGGTVEKVAVPQTLSELSTFSFPLPSTVSRLPLVRPLTPSQILSTSRLPRLTTLSTADQIELNPDDPVLHDRLAQRAYQDEDFTAAAAMYRRVAQLAPHKAHVAENNLAVTLYRQGDLESAIKTWQAAATQAQTMADTLSGKPRLQVMTELARIYGNMGALMRSQSQWASAADVYQIALDQNFAEVLPTIPWARYHREALFALARSSAANNQYEIAEAAYRDAIAAYPEDTIILSDELATLLFNQGKLSEAEAIYETLIQTHPGQKRWLAPALVTIFRAQSRDQAADALMAEIAPPEGVLVQPLRSPPRILTDQTSTSIQAYGFPLPSAPRLPNVTPIPRPSAPIPRPIISSQSSFNLIEPTLPTPRSIAYDRFGRRRLAQGRYRDAQVAFASSIEQSPAHISTLMDYGYALVYQGDVDRAVTTFKQAIEISSEQILCYVFPEESPSQDELGQDWLSQDWQPETYLQTGEACLAVIP